MNKATLKKFNRLEEIFIMSNDNSASIVSKVWNYPHVPKNAGAGYGDCAGHHRKGNKDEGESEKHERCAV